MRKLIIIATFIVLVILLFLLLQPDSSYYSGIMRALNKDIVYFKDGGLLDFWLWDDKGSAAIGEDAGGEILVFDKDKYQEIEENRLLSYLNVLI